MAINEPSDNQQEADPRRTRRNVIAMAGIIASTLVASNFAANNANASHRHDGGGGDDGGGGRACFLAGTHVSTEVGEMAVENLRVGDMVPTVSGEAQAIRRIHSWDAEREPNKDWTRDVAPIKVCRSALALNVPHRDLYLSPLHALYLDGALIKVGVVVNGRSIVRCSNYKADRLSYFHLELEDHQVIFAEGTPVESRLEERMIPFAPIWGGGRRFELRSRLRSAISPWVDGRQIFDKVRDRLDTRGELDLAL